MKISLGCLFVLVLCSVAAFAQENYRLPTSVSPSNYEMEITPYFIAEEQKLPFTFDGNVKITLRTSQTNIMDITLHSFNLEILGLPTLAEIAIPANNIIVNNITENMTTQKITLNLASPITPHVDYILIFYYIGHLNDAMNGFYRSSYVEDGVTKWLGTTQMQPTHARRVFPCFDEPSFKATFNIKINRLSNWSVSYSNTRIIETIISGLRTQEVFHRTPKMSTYLLAFIVSEFKIRENVAKTFGVLARPALYEQTQYAFSIGQQLLTKLDIWMGTKYSDIPEMEKMHMAALPDFSAGAMENWGLLTYRESNQLYDPEMTTDLQQQRIASVITHEQAHMWFGDLVTCEWWSYTWLNEAFARYFTYFGTALVLDTWELDLQFVVERLQIVMAVDQLPSSHAMSFNVNSPSEISGSFDTISYDKGGSVLRMVEHMIGSINFHLALQDYLKLHSYSTVTPDDLSAALQNRVLTDLQIKPIMDSWTLQPGFPLITIVRLNNLTYRISQKRFLWKTPDHQDNSMWNIPITFSSNIESFLNTSTKFFLLNTERSKVINLETDTEWKIFNVQQIGYYRVHYDKKTWESIGKALKSENHSNIHVLNRAQIVDDLFNLARADYIDYYQALNIIQYLEREESYIPWYSAFNNIVYISRRFNAEEFVIYKKYILALLKNIYAKLEFGEKQTDSRTEIYNRVNILNYACKYGHEDCIQSAKDEFLKFQNNATYRVPVNIRPVVYCTVISSGGQTEWNLLWQRYITEQIATEQTNILTALGCSLSKNTLEKYMDLIMTNAVRLQDKSSAFAAVYNERLENIPIIFDYVTNNYDRISAAWGGMSQVALILSNLAARFSTQDQIDKLEQFYQNNSAHFGTSQSIQNALIDAKFNLDWAKQHVPVIIDYFEASSTTASQISFMLLTMMLLFLLV